jgi:drug/metabolite transporter (DMT)-like permease
MSWMPLILLSALCLGVYDVCKKHAVNKNAVLPVLFLSTLTGTILVLLQQLVLGTIAQSFTISGKTGILLFAKAMLVASSWICAFYALRSLPITIASPIRGSQPLWTIAGALLIFGEMPHSIQWVGISIVIIGYLLFSIVGKREGIRFHADPAILLIFLATILGAASGLYDKYLLQPLGLTPQTVQFWFQVDLVVLLGIVLMIGRTSGASRTTFSWRWTILLVGLFLVISDLLYFTALHQPDALISILSPIRRSNAVVSFIVGGALFKDVYKRKKAVALLFIVIGVVLLCLQK